MPTSDERDLLLLSALGGLLCLFCGLGVLDGRGRVCVLRGGSGIVFGVNFGDDVVEGLPGGCCLCVTARPGLSVGVDIIGIIEVSEEAA